MTDTKPVEGEFTEIPTQALVLPDANHRLPGNGRSLAGRGGTRLQVVPRDPDGKAWEIARGETPTWYSRFDIFRSLGIERSLTKAYRAMVNSETMRLHREAVEQAIARGVDTPPAPKVKTGGSAPMTWVHQRNQFRWDERAAAWDRYLSEVARDKELATITAARQKQVQSGTNLRAVGMKALSHISKNVADVKPGEAVLMIKVGDDLVSKGLGLDETKAQEANTMHVKVIDLGDEDDED